MSAGATRLSRHIRAPRSSVYRALLDRDLIPRWRVPDDMVCTVHRFEPREGGAVQISLTYVEPTGRGKTTQDTDAYHGRISKLVQNRLIEEEDEFESSDGAMQGVMRVTFRLSDAEDGTLLEATHEGLPPGVAPSDNEVGWDIALTKLAAILEGGTNGFRVQTD